jgi:NAD(P)-dependent dehydrogenase (short-subunit alcohol dehydrogenase family)
MSSAVLITGSGRGLGYCLTRRHAERGDRVYALEIAITEALAKLAGEYPALEVFQCDVSQDDEVNAALQRVREEEERLDLIYNAAAIFPLEGRVGLAETDMDMALHVINVNTLGGMRVCKAAWPLIGDETLIILLSSDSGTIGGQRRTYEYGYGISKTGVNMTGKLLSNEFWAKGMKTRVMCVHPGWMRTVMGGPDALTSKFSVAPEETAEDILNNITANIQRIPRDQMFMSHRGDILPW